VTLLFDHNLSFRLVRAVETSFPGSRHVASCGLARATDDEVWRFAKREGLTIVTLDADFHELALLRGMPPRIVWLRHFDTSTLALLGLIQTSTHEINAFMRSDEAACLILGR